MNDDRRAILERRARFVVSAIAVVSGCGGSPTRAREPVSVAVPAPESESESSELEPPRSRARTPTRNLPPLDVPAGIGSIARGVYQSLAENVPRLHMAIDELVVPEACDLSEPQCRLAWERHAVRLAELQHDFEALVPVCPGSSEEATRARARVQEHVRFATERLEEVDRRSRARLPEWEKLRAWSQPIRPVVCLDCAIW